MNEPDRHELEVLKQEQTRLSRELALLATRIRRLEIGDQVTGLHRDYTPAPPVQSAAGFFQVPSVQQPAAPPPIPIRIATHAPSLEPVKPVQPAFTSKPGPVPAKRTTSDDGGRSFEMRLGTYWFVRIGIVLVLTALVFFGNFAYQNFIAKLGAGGKIALMYLGSGLLLAGGAWWQRKAVRDSLRNYAEVLFAGGLAAVYFTTYAAHHLENLRVIQNPTIDGLLLLAWAGFMTWVAHRKRSEVLALFSVGLAYYTSVITRTGHFTLYSNLLLTLAAVFFLVRNRWAALSFGSLVATYMGYSFWRFFDGSNWHWASPDAGIRSGIYFLGAYWLVFTCAVFTSRDERFAGQNRATFLTLNNAAFFTLFILTMVQVQSGGFWKFCLFFGGTLLALAEAGRWWLANEPLVKNLYLTQGLLLVTVALIARHSGLHLALVLAVESFLLLLVAGLRRSIVLQTGVWICGSLAVGWATDGMEDFDRQGLYLGMGVGILMISNTLLANRHAQHRAEVVRPFPGYFALLSVIVLVITTWHNCDRWELSHTLAMQGLILTASVYMFRVRELAFVGQASVALGYLAWMANALALAIPPSWQPILLIAIATGLTHWWQRQTQIALSVVASRLWQSLHALALVLVLYTWLQPKCEASTWIAMTSTLAMALTIYAVVTGGWLIGAWGQLFLVGSTVLFTAGLLGGHPEWHLALAPIATLAILSLGTEQWFAARPDSSREPRRTLLLTAQVYRWAALVLTLWWIGEYIPSRERMWVLTAAGIALFVIAGWRRNSEALLLSGAFLIAALAVFWIPELHGVCVYAMDALSLIALLVMQQIVAKAGDRYNVTRSLQNAAILAGGLSLWWFVSRWILESASGLYLTAGWSALALVLFMAGLALRERMYRWLGLAVLACALGRVIVFDVWKLQTLYQILSFMALGIVLLVLGFFYSKYQEKIRQWL